MLAIPGFRGAAQSRSEVVSMELVRRVRYQLDNLKPPLCDAVVIEKPHPAGGVRVLTVYGKPVESVFMALAEGEDKWRFEQLTLGILDEAAYNRQAAGSYASALACVEGGGKLIVISTGKFSTWFNREMIAMMKREQLSTAAL